MIQLSLYLQHIRVTIWIKTLAQCKQNVIGQDMSQF